LMSMRLGCPSRKAGRIIFCEGVFVITVAIWLLLGSTTSEIGRERLSQWAHSMAL
jgi:hypothetical protein